MKLKLIKYILFMSILTSFGQANAAMQINTLERNFFFKFKESQIAIRGYDTVAYFETGKAQKGKQDFQVTWNGAVWLFSSASHKTLFEREPERYAPMYGGYCAFGVAEGYLAKIEGDQWAIVDGKLYLSYNVAFKQRWLDDVPGNSRRADARFAALLQDKAE